MSQLRPSSIGILSIGLVSTCLIAGCASSQYEAKPVSVEQISAKFADKDPFSPAFKNYLQSHGYPPTFDAWGVNELTLIALFYHPKLEVARAELAHSQALEQISAQRSPPTLNTRLGHSNQRNRDVSPWAYGLSVDIPIQTTDKRAIAVTQARQQSELARLDIADIAWQLRSQIAADLLRYQQHQTTLQGLQEELTTRDEIVAMLQKRLEKGAATSIELKREELAQSQARAALLQATNQQIDLTSKLAADVGLSVESFKKLSLKFEPIETVLSHQAVMLDEAFLRKQLQASALLNRIDMRRALTQYEISESNLRLEIAKQYPDFSISPGLAFEFGDTIWSLGISSLLLFTQQNSTHINAAERLRDVEGAKVEATQTDIIQQLQRTYTQYSIANKNLEQFQQQTIAQQTLQNKLEKQFDKGLIDRLTLRLAQLNLIAAQRQLTLAKFEVINAVIQIENAMQAPLDESFKPLNVLENS